MIPHEWTLLPSLDDSRNSGLAGLAIYAQYESRMFYVAATFLLATALFGTERFQ